MKLGHAATAKAAFAQALAADPKLGLAQYGMARAEDLAEHGKSALAWATRLATVNPGHAGALLVQVKQLVLAGKKERARKLMKRLDTMSKRGQLSRAELSMLHTRHAELHMSAGQINQARTRYGAALKAGSRNLDAHLGLGQLYIHAKQYKKALDHLRVAQTLRRKSLRIGMLVAETALALGRIDQSRDALVKLRKLRPNDAKIYNLLGQVEHAAQNDSKAIGAFETAIKKDKEYLEPYLHLSRVHLDHKRTREAFQVLRNAFAVNRDPRVLNAMGETYRKQQKLKKAQKTFEEALKLDPNLNEALFNLANVHRLRGAPDDAFKTLERLRKKDDAFPGLNAELGAVLMALKKPQLAAQAYGLALAAHEPTAELRVAAAYAFAAAGQPKMCFEQANIVFKNPRMAAKAHALRALAFLGQKDYNRALRENRLALEREQNPDYQVVQGRILEKMGRQALALNAYRKALAKAPKDYDLMLDISRLLVRADAMRDALALLDGLIAGRPNLAKAHLYRGIAFSGLQKEAQAIAALERALTLDSSLGEAGFRLAQLLQDKRAYKAAQLRLEKALAHGTRNDYWYADAFFALAQVAKAQNNKPKAIEALRKFLEASVPNDSKRSLAKTMLRNLGAS